MPFKEGLLNEVEILPEIKCKIALFFPLIKEFYSKSFED
jgi:hypothetical protein